jgi:hypothetical protein
MNGMPKYVVSGMLKDPEWSNSTVITLDDVADLKRQEGEDILVNGSAKLVQVLAGQGLVDEYRLMVYPIVLEGLAHTLAYEAAVVGGPVPERLSAVSVPMLVLAGSASSPRMRDAAQAVTDRVGDARLEWLEGQEHGQTDSASMASAVARFFTG